MKNILFIFKLLLILTLMVLCILFINRINIKIILISMNSLLLILVCTTFFTIKNNITSPNKIEGSNLKSRVDDLLNVLEQSNVNEILLKQTYLKTIKLFESLIIDKDTNSMIMAHFKTILDNEIKRSARYKSKFSILLVKIDNPSQFKDDINKLLKEIKNLSKFLLRDMDIIARYNSETLIFLLPETGIKGANTVGGRMLNLLPTINKRKIVNQEVKFSIGISTFPYNGQYHEVLIKNAEKNCSQAEMLGSNQVIFDVEEI